MCGLGCISRDAWLRQTHRGLSLIPIVHATYGRPTNHGVFHIPSLAPRHRTLFRRRCLHRISGSSSPQPANAAAASSICQHSVPALGAHHPSYQRAAMPQAVAPSNKNPRPPRRRLVSDVRRCLSIPHSTPLHSHAHTTRTHTNCPPLSPPCTAPPSLVLRRNDVSHHARADQEEVGAQ